MYLSAEISALERQPLKLPSRGTCALQRADVKQRQPLATTPQQIHCAFHDTLRCWRNIHRAKDVTECVFGAIVPHGAHNERWARGAGDDAFRDRAEPKTVQRALVGRADHDRIVLPRSRVKKNDCCWIALLRADAKGYTLSDCDAATLGHETAPLDGAPIESHTARNGEDKAQ